AASGLSASRWCRCQKLDYERTDGDAKGGNDLPQPSREHSPAPPRVNLTFIGARRSCARPGRPPPLPQVTRGGLAPASCHVSRGEAEDHPRRSPPEPCGVAIDR